MSRDVYFELVDRATRFPLPDTFVDAVTDLPYHTRVNRFRDAVLRKCPNSLANVDAANLRVYANRAVYDEENAQPLEASASVGDLGKDEDRALIVEVPTQHRQQLQRPVLQVIDNEVDERFKKRRKVISMDEFTSYSRRARALLDRIKDFDMNMAKMDSVVDVPFPSLYDAPDRFQLDANRCFKYQARQELASLYDRVVNQWRQQVPTTTDFVGTVGYGKSHMLAVLVLLLLKHRDDLVLQFSEGGEIIEIRPVVIYIPDCRLLLRNEELERVMTFNLLLNDLDCQDLRSSTTPDEIHGVLAGRLTIVIADQWNSIDDDDSKCITARTRLSRCLGISAMVTIHGMSLNSTAWRKVNHKQQTGATILVAGGFNEDEFQVWMEHQNIALLKDHKEELMTLTGCVPLFLFRFARLHRENDMWPTLVQRVMSDQTITNCLQCIETFYTDFDANIVWNVFAHLVPPASSAPRDSYVDHRFFYFDEEHQAFFAVGEILTRLLYQVWKRKADDAAILTLWPERFKSVSGNRPICGFLVEEVIKAIVHRDGIIGKYPKEKRSIARFNFKPGSENTAFRKALNECTDQSWVLLDPDIYNYGGVDMILITGKDIVGINATIASAHSLMSPFFDVWRPIAGTQFKTSGIFIAPDGFAHTEAGVGIVWLKNVYNELWKAIQQPGSIPDHSCTCKGGCITNRCACHKHHKICNSNCKCIYCQNKQWRQSKSLSQG